MPMPLTEKLIALCVLSAVTLCCSGTPVLFENGQSDYSIYVGENAIAAEKTAAKELRDYLKKSANVDLEITDKRTTSKQILVGLSDEAAQLSPDEDFKNWKADEILIAPVGESLILAGGRPRGTLYAVYTFLEKQLGIRFWTATEELIPATARVELPQERLRYAPPIAIRAPYTHSFKNNPPFAARSKVHGPTYDIPAEWGGCLDLIGPWHTFDRFLPAAQYLQSNPEYFSLRDGKRVGGQYQGQLCLSNPAMRQKFLAIILEQLKNHPDPQFISITQNDNFNYCQCPSCAKVDRVGGGPSASMIDFVNFIAEQVEKEFPQVVVQTFAYQYTRNLPTVIRPRQNVSIFLCMIEADSSKPLAQRPNERNQSLMNDLENWGKIAPMLDIWDYVANFNNFLLPHPNFDTIKQNIALYARYNPHLLIMQGDYLNPNDAGDLMALKSWVMAQLMWNPTLDGEALTREFVEGYYGAAAPMVTEYLKLRSRNAQSTPEQVSCFMFSTPWLDGKTLLKGLNLLSEGRKAVENDPVSSARVGKLAKPFEYVLLTEYPRLKNLPGCPSYSELQKISRDYLAFLEENKVSHFSETESIESIEKQIRRIAENDEKILKLPPFFNKLRKNGYVILEEEDFVIAGGDAYGSIVQDPLAANGWALAIPHREYSWAIKLPFRAGLMSDQKQYDIYVAVRLDKPAKQGLYEFGGYDLERRELYINKHIDADTASEKQYTYIPLGQWKLRKDAYLFFGPKINPAISRSLIDHIVLVKK